MSYAIPGLDPVVTAPDTSAYLRAEPTWPDVRSGLARIVVGYLIIIFGNGLGAFLVLFAIFQGHLFADFNKANGWYKICLIVGMVLLGVINIIAYLFYILSGHWRCILNVPDRCGARWMIFICMIFICMTCIIGGPVLHTTTGYLSGGKEVDIRRLERSIQRGERPELPPGLINLQLTCSVIEALSTVFFLLFLRAVARCFDDTSRTKLVEFYMLFLFFMTGASFVLVFGIPKMLAQPYVLLGLGLGWLICVIGYFALIFAIRACIAENLGAVVSPLDLDPADQSGPATFVPGNTL